MEALIGIAILWIGVQFGAWFLREVLPELLFGVLEMLCKLLAVVFKWLWEWTCVLSPYVGRAVVWCAVQVGRRAVVYGPLAWHGLREGAVFLYYVVDELVRDGHPDQQDEDEDAYAYDTEDDEDEEEEGDEDVYEKALQLLGLQTGCSLNEFRRAYKRAISRAHPDKGGTHEQALAINTAREIIMSHNGWTR